MKCRPNVVGYPRDRLISLLGPQLPESRVPKQESAHCAPSEQDRWYFPGRYGLLSAQDVDEVRLWALRYPTFSWQRRRTAWLSPYHSLSRGLVWHQHIPALLGLFNVASSPVGLGTGGLTREIAAQKIRYELLPLAWHISCRNRLVQPGYRLQQGSGLQPL